MWSRVVSAIAVALVGFILSVGSGHAGTPMPYDEQQTRSLAPMLEKALPAVVSISVRGDVPEAQKLLLADPVLRRFLGLPEAQSRGDSKFQAAGSGVIIDAAKGYILTSSHILEAADEITVVLGDGRRLTAEKIGFDAQTDLALLQVRGGGLVQIRFGNSDSLRVGDYVVAIGNPYGLAQTVTSGIISATGRTGIMGQGYENFIQTDAAISPGSSGGALLNLAGELVGINAAFVEDSERKVGIGFAIPINLARQVLKQLLAHGGVQRGELGISMQDLSSDLVRIMRLAVEDGVLVTQVKRNSAADIAGLRAGDVITAVNEKQVRNSGELTNFLGLQFGETTLRLDVSRGGKVLHLVAKPTTALLVRTDGLKRHALLGGIEFGAVDYDSPSCGRLKAVVVLAVRADSVAARIGIEPGDIVIDVDQHPVSTPGEIAAIVEGQSMEILLHIVRGNQAHYLVLKGT